MLFFFFIILKLLMNIMTSKTVGRLLSQEENQLDSPTLSPKLTQIHWWRHPSIPGPVLVYSACLDLEPGSVFCCFSFRVHNNAELLKTPTMLLLVFVHVCTCVWVGGVCSLMQRCSLQCWTPHRFFSLHMSDVDEDSVKRHIITGVGGGTTPPHKNQLLWAEM